MLTKISDLLILIGIGIHIGRIMFRDEEPFHKILHNKTAFAIQRRLQFKGITTVILPVQAEK